MNGAMPVASPTSTRSAISRSVATNGISHHCFPCQRKPNSSLTVEAPPTTFRRTLIAPLLAGSKDAALPGFVEDQLVDHQCVEAAAAERADGFGRRVHDRLPPPGLRRGDEHRGPGARG